MFEKEKVRDVNGILTNLPKTNCLTTYSLPKLWALPNNGQLTELARISLWCFLSNYVNVSKHCSLCIVCQTCHVGTRWELKQLPFAGLKTRCEWCTHVRSCEQLLFRKNKQQIQSLARLSGSAVASFFQLWKMLGIWRTRLFGGTCHSFRAWHSATSGSYPRFPLPMPACCSTTWCWQTG